MLLVVSLVICGLGMMVIPEPDTTVWDNHHLLNVPNPAAEFETLPPLVNSNQPPVLGNRISGTIPLHFIPNQGQVNGNVRFYTKTPGYSLWAMPEGLAFSRTLKDDKQFFTDFSRLVFKGANKKPGITAEGVTEHKVSYFTGNDPAKWQTDIPTSKAVRYSDLYKNIDLKVYGVQKQVEYDWIVKPGGDPNQIGFGYENVKSTGIDENGNLLIETEYGTLSHQKPVSYQMIDGQRKAVNAEFIKKGNNTYSFNVGEYDRNHELVIDPLVLVHGTYVGGKYSDTVADMTIDNNGNVYLIGHTVSGSFPLRDPYKEAGEVFVLKMHIDSDGQSTLLFSTFIGSRYFPAVYDRGYGIAVDSQGMIYVAGTTRSTRFPVKNYWQENLRGPQDAFVAKFDPSLTGKDQLVFCTLLGGHGSEDAFDIAVDDNGNAYVTGVTTSDNFPVKNGYQTTHGNGIGSFSDAFITKLDTTTSGNSVLVYSSYLGSGRTDSGNHIAVGTNGNVYISGTTDGFDFPVKNAFQSELNDPDLLHHETVFVTRIDTSKSWGASLVYSTYLGDVNPDIDGGIAVDGNGNVYLTGYTRSTDFPVRNAYQSFMHSFQDIFAAKINTNASGDSSLVYSTFLGGEKDIEEGTGIAVDNSGNAYITGKTNSDNFPILDQLSESPGGGGTDAFITKLNPNGNGLLFSTLLGGNSLEDSSGIGIALDDADNIYVAGFTRSTTFPVTPGAFQGFRAGHEDCFIVKIQQDSPEPPPAGKARIALNREKIQFGASVSGAKTGEQTVIIGNSGEGSLNWSLSDNRSWLNCAPDSGVDNGVITISIDPAGLAAGLYTGEVTVSDPNAANSPKKIEVSLTVYSPGNSQAPFGYFDTPLANSTVMSSIPVTGWALDDIGIQSVKIYRSEGSNHVYIGDANFVEGTRPDVELAYPDYPNCYKAGWGYMLLTNFLPNGGNGVFTLHAKAVDYEGKEIFLGSKTITCDNANAVKPFGAIDTPEQGGIASGNQYVNFGWVLTPMPNKVPEDGNTIYVWVDGTRLSHPVYNQYRSDIATLFPGYANSGGAVGYFYLDTTSYSNGIHTIQWTATDTGGNTDGIGSRYFTIQNSSADANNSTEQNNQTVVREEVRERLTAEKAIREGLWTVDKSTPVRVFNGYSDKIKSKDMEILYPDEKGDVTIEIRELDRIVLQFEELRNLKGWMRVGERLKRLPVGSSINGKKKEFLWMTGPAFYGEYRLVFTGEDIHGDINVKNILIRIAAKY